MSVRQLFEQGVCLGERGLSDVCVKLRQTVFRSESLCLHAALTAACLWMFGFTLEFPASARLLVWMTGDSKEEQNCPFSNIKLHVTAIVCLFLFSFFMSVTCADSSCVFVEGIVRDVIFFFFLLFFCLFFTIFHFLQELKLVDIFNDAFPLFFCFVFYVPDHIPDS